MERITSRKNPYIRSLSLMRKHKGEHLFIEGEKLISEAVMSGYSIETLLFSEDFSGATATLSSSETRVISVSREIIELLSTTNTPQGVIALTKRRPRADLSGITRKSGYYVILDRVSDPGNVGTIIRTAEAFGASGVVLCGGCADLYNDKTLRATMGAAFRMGIYHASDAVEAVAAFQGYGAKVYASALDNAAKKLTELSFPGFFAFVIGNESAGVSPDTIKMCDETVFIPMTGGTESLNAAVAASIILWEAFSRS